MSPRLYFLLCITLGITLPVAVPPLGAEGTAPPSQVTAAKPAASGPNVAEAAKAVLQQTHRFRAEQKLSKVTSNAVLTKTAQEFADVMARTNKFGHNVDGKSPGQRAMAAGYDYCLIAENIASQSRSTEFTTEQLVTEFINGWKDSPGHRKNMLDPDVTETGAAIARSASGTFYAVQMFGRPKSGSIEFEIANQSNAAVEYLLGDQKHSLDPRVTSTHQVCRPVTVTVGLQKIQPAAGDRFVITSVKGSLEIRNEPDSSPRQSR